MGDVRHAVTRVCVELEFVFVNTDHQPIHLLVSGGVGTEEMVLSKIISHHVPKRRTEVIRYPGIGGVESHFGTLEDSLGSIRDFEIRFHLSVIGRAERPHFGGQGMISHEFAVNELIIRAQTIPVGIGL